MPQAIAGNVDMLYYILAFLQNPLPFIESNNNEMGREERRLEKRFSKQFLHQL
jgi:hypothetical protein